MASKREYILKVIDATTRLAQAMADLELAVKVWDDRLYGPGGTNAITDADIKAANTYADGTISGAIPDSVTANNLYEMIITANQYKTLSDNGAPVKGAHRSTINKIRSDI